MVVTSTMIASIIGGYLGKHGIEKIISVAKPITQNIAEDVANSYATDYVKDNIVDRILSKASTDDNFKSKLQTLIAKAFVEILEKYKKDQYVSSLDSDFVSNFQKYKKYVNSNVRVLFSLQQVIEYQISVEDYHYEENLLDLFSQIGVDYKVAEYLSRSDFYEKWIEACIDNIALDDELYNLIVFRNVQSILQHMDVLEEILSATKSLNIKVKDLLDRNYESLCFYNKYLHSKYSKQELIFDKGIIERDIFDVYYQQTINRKVGLFYCNYYPEYVLPKDIEQRKTDLNREIECMEFMPIETMFYFYDNVFLYADSGYGKTIFVRYLISLLTGISLGIKKYLLRNSQYVKELAEYLIIPFSCLDYEKSWNHSSDYNTLLQRYAEIHNISDLMHIALSNGKILLIFDDFNKFSNKKTATEFCRTIRSFKEVYPNSKCLVLSGDESSELYEKFFSSFEFVSINPLLSSEVEHYIASYCRLFRIEPKMQLQLYGELVSYLWDTRYTMIIENPKYVTLILNLYVNGDIDSMDIASIYGQICKELVGDLLKELFPDYSIRRLENVSKDFETFISELAFLHLYDGKATFEQDVIEDRLIYYFENDSDRVMSYLINNKFCILLFTRGEFYFSYACRFAIEYYASKRLVGKSDFISVGTDICKSSYNLWKSSFCLSMLTSGIDIGTSAVRSVLYNLSEDNYLDEIRMASQALCMFDKSLLESRGERKDVLEKCKTELKNIINNIEDIPPIEKNEFAKYLSQLGDDRSGVSSIIPDFVLIQKGEVVLGGDSITYADKYIYDINYDYYISKYPITNAQYQFFLNSCPDYPLPSDSGHIWDIKTRCIDRRYLNHPVVGINFADALSYCKWLNSKMDATQIFNEKYEIMIPSDAEWLKAYRGSMDINNDPEGEYAPLYPWGNEWIDDYANTPIHGSSAYSTSAVGIYEHNISVYGVCDLCGNVLEWTSTIWGNSITESLFKNPYTPEDGREDINNFSLLRIARGGSWLFAEGTAKCSCRLNPEQKFPDTGFRIVYVPQRSSK